MYRLFLQMILYGYTVGVRGVCDLGRAQKAAACYYTSEKTVELLSSGKELFYLTIYLITDLLLAFYPLEWTQDE